MPCVPDDSRPLDPTSAVWMRGLVFASDGDVVRAVDPAAGKVFRLAGGGSDPAVVEGPAKLACFRGVSGVAIDEAGLWFGDTKNGAVRRLDFASDRVTTLAEGLPEPVELARNGSTVYVGCRQGELFEIDAGTAERRPLEAVRGAVVGLTVVARSLYAATAAGAVLGIDRTNGRVTQRLAIEGSMYCVAQNPHSSLPWLWVGLPGRIHQLRVPTALSSNSPATASSRSRGPWRSCASTSRCSRTSASPDCTSSTRATSTGSIGTLTTR